MNITLNQFYALSELLNDDTYQAAFVIRAYHSKEIKMTDILKHLNNLKLDDYAETLDMISAQSESTIKECTMGITFTSERAYIDYLSGLLRLNNIGFSPFVKCDCKSEHIQRPLFD